MILKPVTVDVGGLHVLGSNEQVKKRALHEP